MSRRRAGREPAAARARARSAASVERWRRAPSAYQLARQTPVFSSDVPRLLALRKLRAARVRAERRPQTSLAMRAPSPRAALSPGARSRPRPATAAAASDARGRRDAQKCEAKQRPEESKDAAPRALATPSSSSSFSFASSSRPPPAPSAASPPPKQLEARGARPPRDPRIAERCVRFLRAAAAFRAARPHERALLAWRLVAEFLLPDCADSLAQAVCASEAAAAFARYRTLAAAAALPPTLFADVESAVRAYCAPRA
jgi:hypothetical protein